MRYLLDEVAHEAESVHRAQLDASVKPDAYRRRNAVAAKSRPAIGGDADEHWLATDKRRRNTGRAIEIRQHIFEYLFGTHPEVDALHVAACSRRGRLELHIPDPCRLHGDAVADAVVHVRGIRGNRRRPRAADSANGGQRLPLRVVREGHVEPAAFISPRSQCNAHERTGNKMFESCQSC